ncbi:EI24-domain-containing protein [Hesseltinella vesiculosa]|uniref:EI24-domain-containing protein n=1 Tax=Hesseltinella vesiculosa TaxID=101127 RepID=A0A1X2G8T6_9FUNG|nr:EI24-domain-containing protein [Hesseltinella vesiculosa]
MSSNSLSAWPTSFLDGMVNALAWHKLAYVLPRSRTIRNIMIKTVVLNGFIWLGSLVILDVIFKNRLLFGWKYSQLTGYPLYLICLSINSKWLDKMARATIQLGQHGVFQYTQPSVQDTKASLSSTLYLISFYSSCILAVAVLRTIPWIGVFLGFLLNAVIMAYYCFEYKWIDLGWTQQHRMAFVERHWAYFLGFGLPGTLMTYFLSTLRAGAVFALIFPFFVIVASVSTMKPYDNSRLPRVPWMFSVRTMNRVGVHVIQWGLGSHSSANRYSQDGYLANKDKV